MVSYDELERWEKHSKKNPAKVFLYLILIVFLFVIGAWASGYWSRKGELAAQNTKTSIEDLPKGIDNTTFEDIHSNGHVSICDDYIHNSEFKHITGNNDVNINECKEEGIHSQLKI